MGAEGHRDALLNERFADANVDLRDGIKIFDERGWVQVLPDPDEPLDPSLRRGSDRGRLRRARVGAPEARRRGGRGRGGRRRPALALPVLRDVTGFCRHSDHASCGRQRFRALFRPLAVGLEELGDRPFVHSRCSRHFELAAMRTPLLLWNSVISWSVSRPHVGHRRLAIDFPLSRRDDFRSADV